MRNTGYPADESTTHIEQPKRMNSGRRANLALARRRLVGLAAILDEIHRPAEAVATRNIITIIESIHS